MTSFRKNNIITDFLQILFRERQRVLRIFAFSFTLSLVVCGVVIYWWTPEYKKSGVMKIEAEANSDGRIKIIINATASERNQQEKTILQSRSLMMRVVEKLHANIDYSYNHNLKRQVIFAPPFYLEGADNYAGRFAVDVLSDINFNLINEEDAVVGQYAFDSVFVYKKDTFLLNSNSNLHYYIGERIDVDVWSVTQMADRMLSGMSVGNIGKNSDILSISLTGTNPRRLESIVNSLMETYINEGIEAKTAAMTNSREWIKGRIDTLFNDIKTLEVEIEQYKKQQNTLAKPMEADLYMKNALQLEENLYTNDVMLQHIESLVEYLSDSTNMWSEIPNTVPHEYIAKDIESYNQAVIRLKTLAKSPENNNPVIKTVKMAIQSLRGSITRNVDKYYESLQLEQGELISRKSGLVNRIEDFASHVKNQTDLLRIRRVKRALYRYLTRKYETTMLTMQRIRPEARIIEYSYSEDKPFSPRKKRICLFGLVFAFGLPCIPVVWKLLFVNTIDGKDDVTDVVTAPVLGVIPSKPIGFEGGEMVVRASGSDPITEAFRMVRSGLSFINEGKCRVIASSSTIPGEGKSYVSMNLAMTLTMTGKSVCLVDLDLRRRTLSNSFGVKRSVGVTEYLTAKSTDLNKMVNRTVYSDKLFVLSAGKMPPNPAELLMTSNYDRMVSELRQMYDYVIIDNPPLNVVADGMIANRAVDMTCYIIRAGKLDRRELPYIEEVFQEKQLKNFTVIVTDVPMQRRKLFF